MGHLRSVKTEEEARSEIIDRFGYHALDDLQQKKVENCRDEFIATAEWINKYVPVGREQALALTALEEASMWANKAIARG
jgi:hypothetical protein